MRSGAVVAAEHVREVRFHHQARGVIAEDEEMPRKGIAPDDVLGHH